MLQRLILGMDDCARVRDARRASEEERGFEAALAAWWLQYGPAGFRDLLAIIQGYSATLAPQIALRVGRWHNAPYGGEPCYMARLPINALPLAIDFPFPRDARSIATAATSLPTDAPSLPIDAPSFATDALRTGKGVSSFEPTVRFPYDDVKSARSCPAIEPPPEGFPLRPITGLADEGMRVMDDGARLTIQFPSRLTFLEHIGYHVLPFEKIGIRYRTGPRSPWTLLFQLRRKRNSGDEWELVKNSVRHSVDLQVQYQNKAPLHYISQIIIQSKIYSYPTI